MTTMNLLNGQVIAPFSQWQGVAIIAAAMLVASLVRRVREACAQ
jgi:hypothetical protein